MISTGRSDARGNRELDEYWVLNRKWIFLSGLKAENVGAKYIFYGHKTEFKAYNQFYKMMYRVNWEKKERIRKGDLGECKVNSYISIQFSYLD